MAEAYFQSILQKITFISFSKQNNECLQSKIVDKIVLIYYQSDEEMFNICFDDKIITSDKTNFPQLLQFLHDNNISQIYYMTTETREKLLMFIDNSILLEKIFFNQNQILKLSCYIKINRKISELIAAYLLQKSYINSKYDPEKKSSINPQLNSCDYIRISSLGSGSGGSADLMYNIKTEKLYVIKFPYEQNGKLMKREIENYQKIKQPFIPRFYGTISYHLQQGIVIDYIAGHSLRQIKEMQLNVLHKTWLMIIVSIYIERIHSQNFIYRDLRPENIIINDNLNLFLIDLDRMIQNIDENKGEQSTIDFDTCYIAPEIVKRGKISFEADIYSLGVLFYYIINEKEPKIQYNEKNDYYLIQIDHFNSFFQVFEDVCKKCTEIEIEKRPTLSQLIGDLLTFFYKNFTNVILSNPEVLKLFEKFISKRKNTDEIYHSLGLNFYEGTNVKKDLNKAIHYLKLSAKQNNSSALITLGGIYMIENDTNKSIDCLLKAAKLNNSEAQYLLGMVFLNGKVVPKNINKAIIYFTLSSNQNNPLAQYELGKIYEKENYDKSIYYLTLSANQNNPDAQCELGILLLSKINESHDINKVIHYLKLSADQNNSEAQFLLGSIYSLNDYVPKDMDKALYYLKLSADQNNINAQNLLSDIYTNGKCISRNIDKSIYYSSLSAKTNDPEAQYKLGKLYFDNKLLPQNIEKAIYYLNLSANQNHSGAQFYLGNIMLMRKYNHFDIKNGINYLTKSAEQNNSNAQHSLGMIYYKGEFVPRDMQKAVYYLTQSANSNNENAQFHLGMIYFMCQYYPRNIKQAVNYLTKSANQNNSEAQYYLGMIYLRGENDAPDPYRAIHYLTLSAEQNNIKAQLALGSFYYENKYGLADIKKSMYYLDQAANRNDANSQYLLGVIYYEEKYIPRDINKAIDYFTRSANQNNSDSQFFLGIIFYDGKFVPQDIKKAIKYLSYSAYLNNDKAQYLLGYIYYEGKYVTKDMKKSINYFHNAAKQGNWRAKSMLGCIYYAGKYISRDANQAILYFKEASNHYDSISKNELGIIYKNGEFVKKNIALAIEYFNESIKIDNNLYALFNLSRIYYFGIDCNVNLTKAIDLLENPSAKYFFPITCFLYFIYKYGDKSLINEKKAAIYKEKMGNQFLSKIFNPNIRSANVFNPNILGVNSFNPNILGANIFNQKIINTSIFNANTMNEIYKNLILLTSSNAEQIVKNRMHKFFKEYDIMYSFYDEFVSNFMTFMLNGVYCKEYTEPNTNAAKAPDKKKLVDINELFYEGFNGRLVNYYLMPYNLFFSS